MIAPTDTLTFRYIVAFRVEGLQGPAAGSLLLFEDVNQGKKVLLTNYSHESLQHIDIKVTIANFFLNATFAGQAVDFGEVRNQSPKEQAERVRRFGSNAAYLVVEASHEQEASAIGQIGEGDNRDYCLALPNGFVQATQERHKQFIDQSQAFLSFAMPKVSGFESIGQCVVAGHPNGKPIYVLSFGMSGRLSVLSPVLDEGALQFAELLAHLSKLAPLQTAFRLAAASASNSQDVLRAFLFAFTALEVFVSKFASLHESQLNLLTEKDYSSKIHAHIERLRKEEKEHVLSYKFARVSSYLALGNLDEIIDEFDRANRFRNDIVHGKPFDESVLPTSNVRAWLGELIRLYVAREEI